MEQPQGRHTGLWSRGTDPPVAEGPPQALPKPKPKTTSHGRGHSSNSGSGSKRCMVDRQTYLPTNFVQVEVVLHYQPTHPEPPSQPPRPLLCFMGHECTNPPLQNLQVEVALHWATSQPALNLHPTPPNPLLCLMGHKCTNLPPQNLTTNPSQIPYTLWHKLKIILTLSLIPF